MKRLCAIMAGVYLAVGMSGCGLLSGKGDAEKVAEAFLEDRIAIGGFAGPDEYYSGIFRQNTNEEQWESILQLVGKAMGNLKSYSLREWNTQSKVHTSQLSGTFVVLVYDTEYEKGKGQEKLTMHKGTGGKDFKIIGHNINSPRIQEMIKKGIEEVAKE
jgi:hypothetical protein